MKPAGWVLAAVGILFAGILLARLCAPPLVESIPWSTAVLARDGTLLRLTLSSDDKFRVHVPLAEVPAELVSLLQFKEDRHFWRHPGVNPAALVRAAVSTFGGGARMGGSTITMQLARLKYRMQTRTPWGKVKQILAAIHLDAMYGKEEILEAYLGLLPYGGNVEGIGSASLVYFGKPLSDLSFSEMMTLVVIPQSPEQRGDVRRRLAKLPASLLAARASLFARWKAEHPESPNDATILAQRIVLRSLRDLPFRAPHFVERVLEDAAPGSTIRTTLMSDLQRFSERKIRDYVERKHLLGVDNAAMLLADWRTGEVLARVGSADYFNARIQGQVDGTAALRSPGSTLKPFAYALAFEQGILHPLSLLKDAPASFGGFDPENFDRDFMGPLSAEQALIHSRNLPAVSVAARLKQPSFFEFLQNVGIPNLKPAGHYGLASVLGGLEVRMEDLVRLYAALASGGLIQNLTMDLAHPPPHSRRILSREASFLVLDILAKGPRPAGARETAWQRRLTQVAWKTGTSHAFRDAWTLGVFGNYVLGVWLGHFDSTSNLSLVGRELAAPLFFELADGLRALPGWQDLRWSSDGLELKQVKVCSVSGAIPTSACKHQRTTWFLPGKSPIAACDIHRTARISTRTGRLLCAAVEEPAVEKVLEFWPSDLLKLFAQARVPRAQLPAWDQRCQEGFQFAAGQPPQIVSPRNDVSYSMGLTGKVPQIALAAVADADVREMFWFVDETFVGTSQPREALYWKAREGSHVVRVVDDQGRADSRPLRVQAIP